MWSDLTGLRSVLQSTAAPCDGGAPGPSGGGVVQTAGPGQRGGATEAVGGEEAPQREADMPPATVEANPTDCSALL